MRTLYYVPIIHTSQELGSMGIFFERVEEQTLGRQKAVMLKMEIQNYWQLVAERLTHVPLMYNQLYIYMDSLPTLEEAKNLIQKDYVQRGLPTYLLIDSLVTKGAKLIGTESPELLQAECNHWQGVVQTIKEKRTVSFEEDSQSKKRAKELLQKRDAFIAQRINETLLDGYEAILFIGGLHKVIEELDKLEEARKLTYPLRVVYL